MDLNVTRRAAGIKLEHHGWRTNILDCIRKQTAACRYTLRSSSDPRGRLRGGVAAGLAEAVAGGFIPPGGNPPAAIGGGTLMTRAGWMFAGRA